MIEQVEAALSRRVIEPLQPCDAGLVSASMRQAMRRRWASHMHTIRALGRRGYLAEGWEHTPDQFHDRWGRGWPLEVSPEGQMAMLAWGRPRQRGAVYTVACDRCGTLFTGSHEDRRCAGWRIAWERVPGTGIELQQDVCNGCRMPNRRPKIRDGRWMGDAGPRELASFDRNRRLNRGATVFVRLDGVVWECTVEGFQRAMLGVPEAVVVRAVSPRSGER